MLLLKFTNTPILSKFLFIIFFCLLIGCKEKRPEPLPIREDTSMSPIEYAKGFTIETSEDGITIIKITSPWPEAERAFTYALLSKEKMAFTTLNTDAYDAIITVPVESMVVTSTTHIPALEALEVLDKLVGFPDTKYISSKKTRQLISEGAIVELGGSETMNTELVLELNPEVVVGYGVSGENKAYETLKRSHIPVVYNGEWMEESPLGKAEWIKFFALFFKKEALAETLFTKIEEDYHSAKSLAATSVTQPSVLSGALYKDVWYLPGGKSWASQFIKDANARYLWDGTPETGSLSLSLENVLVKAKAAEFWISPSQFKSYPEMLEANEHYAQFNAFQNHKVYTFASTTGDTGGLLFYELGPNRPDLILKDLIHIFHPEVLPDHQLFFFKPLQ